MNAAEQAKLDPLWKYLKRNNISGFLNFIPDPLQNCYIPNDDILVLLEDLLARYDAKALRAGARMQAKINGFDKEVLVIEAYADTTWAVLCMDDKQTYTVSEEDICVIPSRYSDLRFPLALWEKIRDADFDDMTTDSRFYLINKGDAEDVQYRLLDQTSLITALQTIAPVINLKVCYALTKNILVRFGVDADINQDGVISAEEWEALCALLDDRTPLRGNATISVERERSRLVAAMLS